VTTHETNIEKRVVWLDEEQCQQGKFSTLNNVRVLADSLGPVGNLVAQISLSRKAYLYNTYSRLERP